MAIDLEKLGVFSTISEQQFSANDVINIENHNGNAALTNNGRYRSWNLIGRLARSSAPKGPTPIFAPSF